VAGLSFGLAGLLAAGCAGPDQTGSPSQRMRAWVQGTGFGASVGTLQADGQRIGQVTAQNRGAGAIRTDCALLTTDAEAANSNLPSPDDQVTQQLAQAYSLLYGAGTDCYSAGSANRSLMARSARQRTQATTLLDRVLAEIRHITGSSVSTTTTAPPPGGNNIFGLGPAR
jgi:hypothetical protein